MPLTPSPLAIAAAAYAALIASSQAADYYSDPAAVAPPISQEVVPVPRVPVPYTPVPVPVPAPIPVPAPVPTCRPGVVTELNGYGFPAIVELAIRSGPGVQFVQIGGLLSGWPVTICGHVGSWGRLPSGGWISLRFVMPVAPVPPPTY